MSRIQALLAAMAIALTHSQPAQALTVYRIGGENLPPPEIGGEFEFVQIPWVDVDPLSHGLADLVDLTQDSIAPLQMDANVNLTPKIKGELGGNIQWLQWIGWAVHEETEAFMWDEDPVTAYLGDGHFASHNPAQKHLRFNLGGRFLIDRLEFYPREEHLEDRFIEKFLIGHSDGDPLKDGTRDITIRNRLGVDDYFVAVEIEENTRGHIVIPMPRTPIETILFKGFENTRGIWEIAEFEIYAVGFAPEAEYRTNVIDLGSPVNIGRVEWSGRVDHSAGVALSMHAGDDVDPNNYWRFTFRGDERSRFASNGSVINLRAYQSLETAEKAGITHDTENWDFWSTPYDFNRFIGDASSDRPRRYVRFRSLFTSTVDAGSEIEYVQFQTSVPLSTQTLAEITPSIASAGESTSFTYKIKPRLDENDPGFDGIEIGTPTMPAGIDAVRISGQDVPFEIVRMDSSGFALTLPRIDLQRTEELVEVDFRSQVFKFGTQFPGRVFDSDRPQEVPQQLTPGDADPLSDSDVLQVDLESLRVQRINSLEISSTVVTPNGDGINDEVTVSFDLLNLSGAVPSTIKLYDLGGRLVAQVLSGNSGSGSYRASWDGRGTDDEILAPGVYLLRLEVDSDQGMAQAMRSISVAY
ncbi:MAG: gliding motility-associated C-terminal domain-containing protein [Candidatus Latescibacterota bacterium]|nr:gliding motility-associated C-terminal domain-containing protein [Candidatus Latescibacterota bacterium]